MAKLKMSRAETLSFETEMRPRRDLATPRDILRQRRRRPKVHPCPQVKKLGPDVSPPVAIKFLIARNYSYFHHAAWCFDADKEI
jgi:hypothetical protein